MSKNIIQNIKFRVRNRLILSLIFECLSKIGFKIRPFYLSEEILFDEFNLNMEPSLETYSASFLTPTEIKNIYDHPESQQLDRDSKKLIEEGYKCFGLKSCNEVTTYLWCNLYKCHEVYPFILKEDESYVTGVFTFEAYRGKNLAKILRCELYKYLNQIGRNKIYSLVNIFNTPAIKLHKKLRAKLLKIVINIEIFNKYERTIVIRSPKQFLPTI